MKTKILLAGLAVGILGFFSRMEAQVTTPGWTGTGPGYGVAFRDSSTEVPAQATNIDSVTVGSTMPYMVKGDLNMHALRKAGVLDYSDFTWALSGGGTLNPHAAKDTVVNITWGNTAGTYNLNVTEVPDVVLTGAPSFCNGNTQKLPITVFARPTLAWPSNDSILGGCNVAGTSVALAVDVTGTGQFAITYNITYTDLAGNTTSFVATKTETLGTFKHGSQTLNLQALAIPANTYGYYTLTIENMSDRISRKSGVATVKGTDRPDTRIKVYSYPAPATQPIQHIKNL